MRSTFGFTQAMRRRVAFRLLEARKAFRFVEIEMFITDDALEVEKVLHVVEHPTGVGDEFLAADEMHLLQREEFEPLFEVTGVDADFDSTPRRVDESGVGIEEGQLFE